MEYPTSTTDSPDLRSKAENFARQEPLQAVGYAFLGGVVLTFFPVAGVITAIVRLALALLRPALVVLGGIKLYEEISKRSGQTLK